MRNPLHELPLFTSHLWCLLVWTCTNDWIALSFLFLVFQMVIMALILQECCMKRGRQSTRPRGCGQQVLSVTTLSLLVECRLPRDGLRIENNASKCFPWAQQFVHILYRGHMRPQAPSGECQNRTSLTVSKQKSSGPAHWWKWVGTFPLSPLPKWPRAPGVPYELKSTLLSDLPWPPYQARHLFLFLLSQEWPSLVCCAILSLS